MNKLFCKGASGALVVGDITDLESIENTVNWKAQVSEHVSSQKKQFDYSNKNSLVNNEEEEEEDSIPMLLVLNKYDLVEELISSGHDPVEHMTPDYLSKFADEYGFIGAMSTSAKTG